MVRCVERVNKYIIYKGSACVPAFVGTHLLRVVVVVVLTLTRIIKSVVTGQAPVTLEMRIRVGKGSTSNCSIQYLVE